MVNARRRKNETASSLYLSLHIRWDRHNGASAHRLHSRVGKCRLIVFLRQVCTDLSQNRACASQRTRLPIFCSISKVIPF